MSLDNTLFTKNEKNCTRNTSKGAPKKWGPSQVPHSLPHIHTTEGHNI